MQIIRQPGNTGDGGGRRAPDGLRRPRVNRCMDPAFLLLVCLLVFAGGTEAAAEEPGVGELTYARGAVTAQGADGSVRLLGKGGAVQRGDVLTTARRSYAVLKMNDDSKLTLRPNTAFKVEKFAQGKKKEENSVIMRLFRGGLRALTGLIGKRNPTGYKIHTAVATIGIRGTEFETRLCADDCTAGEAETSAKTAPPGAAQVAFLHGRITAKSATAEERRLVLGGTLHKGDTVETPAGSRAVLAFHDGSRVTLLAGTKFKIEGFRFNRERPKKNSLFLRLMRGGLRAVTGLIGKRNRHAYQLKTPVATIGIRGTGFDLICQGDCGAGTRTGSLMPESVFRPLKRLLGLLIREALAQMPAGSGMGGNVWQGAIEVNGTEFTEGQSFFLDARGGLPIFLPQPIPVTAPKPRKARQLLVNVTTGSVNVTSGTKTVKVGKGNSISVDGIGQIARMDHSPDLDIRLPSPPGPCAVQ